MFPKHRRDVLCVHLVFTTDGNNGSFLVHQHISVRSWISASALKNLAREQEVLEQKFGKGNCVVVYVRPDTEFEVLEIVR